MSIVPDRETFLFEFARNLWELVDNVGSLGDIFAEVEEEVGFLKRFSFWLLATAGAVTQYKLPISFAD